MSQKPTQSVTGDDSIMKIILAAALVCFIVAALLKQLAVNVVPLQDTCSLAKLFDGEFLRDASQPVGLPEGWIHVRLVAKTPSRGTSECYIPPTHDRTFDSKSAALQYVKEQNILVDEGDVNPKHALQS